MTCDPDDYNKKENKQKECADKVDVIVETAENSLRPRSTQCMGHEVLNSVIIACEQKAVLSSPGERTGI